MTATAPFFSVIIPTYNRADLIITTIESVLSQTFTDYEILVIDNKSTDDTVDRLQTYVKSGKISLFVQEKNFERATSRNKGFSEARGQYVTLLDSDDILYPSCLQDAFDFHQQNKEVHFFHSSHDIIDGQGKVLVKGNLHKVDKPFEELAKGNYISNIGIFILRDVVRNVKLDETPVLIGMEDYDFILRVLFETKQIGFVGKINCGVLIHPKRTVLTQDMPTIQKRVDYFVDKTIHSILFEADFREYKKSFISSNQLYLCGAAAIRGLSWKATGYLLKAATSNIPGIFTIRFWRHFLVIIKYMFK